MASDAVAQCLRRNRRYSGLHPALMPSPCGPRICGLPWNGSPDFEVMFNLELGKAGKPGHRFPIS